MKELKVYIEIEGEQTYVGRIVGESSEDAAFIYSQEYIDKFSTPISIALPTQEESFSAEQTKSFFESILPEGFSRRAVANWIKTDENDYLTILLALGRECLGAIKIIDSEVDYEPHYELLSIDQVKALAAEGATKSTQMLIETHLSLAGASGKVGLYLGADGKWYLPKGDAPSTHIVKQSHVRLDKIVLNEQLCMLAASNIGIEVPESFIINLGSGRDEDVLYATQRYDRVMLSKKTIDGMGVPLRLHQEDFAQALGIKSADKYETSQKGYMEKMFGLLEGRSSDPITDKQELLKRIVFNYLIGNTDGHIKNYALLYGPDLKSIRLAPAYDIVATRVYKTTSNMSFFIGDKLDIDHISRLTFIEEASKIGMSRRMVESIFDTTANAFETALSKARSVLLEKGFKDADTLNKKILETGGYSKL